MNVTKDDIFLTKRWLDIFEHFYNKITFHIQSPITCKTSFNIVPSASLHLSGGKNPTSSCTHKANDRFATIKEYNTETVRWQCASGGQQTGFYTSRCTIGWKERQEYWKLSSKKFFPASCCSFSGHESSIRCKRFDRRTRSPLWIYFQTHSLHVSCLESGREILPGFKWKWLLCCCQSSPSSSVYTNSLCFYRISRA